MQTITISTFTDEETRAVLRLVLDNDLMLDSIVEGNPDSDTFSAESDLIPRLEGLIADVSGIGRRIDDMCDDFERRISALDKRLAAFDAGMGELDEKINGLARITSKRQIADGKPAFIKRADEKALAAFHARKKVKADNYYRNDDAIRLVECRACGAIVGNQCVSPGGNYYGRSFVHNDRLQALNMATSNVAVRES